MRALPVDCSSAYTDAVIVDASVGRAVTIFGALSCPGADAGAGGGDWSWTGAATAVVSSRRRPR